MSRREPSPCQPENSGIRSHALDRPFARIVAFGVFLLAGLALAWIHKDDIFMTQAGSVADPVALCFAERAAGIDKMVREGVIDEPRAILFKDRAQALCQDQQGTGVSLP